MINTIIQGVLLGGYYALIAAGLSFMFSVMRIINLAHGSLAVLAAYLLLILAQSFGISPFLGLIIVLPAMAGIGFLLQRFVLDRALRAGQLVPILATFGLAIVIDNALFEGFGANTRSLSNYIGTLSYDSIELPGGIYVGELSVGVFVLAIVVLGGLQLFLSFTSYGRAIRATSEDPDTATTQPGELIDHGPPLRGAELGGVPVRRAAVEAAEVAAVGQVEARREQGRRPAPVGGQDARRGGEGGRHGRTRSGGATVVAVTPSAGAAIGRRDR